MAASTEAGIVPVPVAAMIDGSACCSNHWIVSPSDLLPNSLVSWNILAAHKAGMRIRRPRPSTLVCLSLLDVRLGASWFCFLVVESCCFSGIIICKLLGLLLVVVCMLLGLLVSSMLVCVVVGFGRVKNLEIEVEVEVGVEVEVL